MMRLDALRGITAIVGFSALSACEGPASPDRVRDGFLHDDDGRAIIMRGVNLAGAHKNAPYLDDKQPADYARIRADWGFNAVRFVMTWAAVEPEEGRFDDAYLDRVAERLAWAADSGLMIVLEMHQDIYGEGFGFDGAPRWACDASHYEAFVPQSPWFLNSQDPHVIACVDGFFTRDDLQTHFAEAWRRVAARFADEPAVIGFDVLNEPHWGSYPIFTFERDRLAPLYERVVTTVREVAPHWTAFLEPSASRNGGLPTSLYELPFPNVMYAPHSYDVMAESGGGFDNERRQRILDNVTELAREARELNAGLWIGEYGGVASSSGIVDYMTAQYDAAGSVAGSTMYWSYDKSDGYGLLNPDGTEKANLLGALVRPYPARIAGVPISYAFDAATSTFTLEYEADPAVKAPTRIVVPNRSYPNGYSVECGGCQHERDGDELVIVKVHGGSTSIVVRP
jgi:endoglycosylceramidase